MYKTGENEIIVELLCSIQDNYTQDDIQQVPIHCYTYNYTIIAQHQTVSSIIIPQFYFIVS